MNSILADKIALEFGDSGENVEYEFAAGCRGVDALAHGIKMNAFIVEACQQVREEKNRAAQPVEFENNEHITGFKTG